MGSKIIHYVARIADRSLHKAIAHYIDCNVVCITDSIRSHKIAPMLACIMAIFIVHFLVLYYI
jgi:hypothetical protein